MKKLQKPIAAVCMVLLLAGSILASCSNGKTAESSPAILNFKAERVGLDLADDQHVLDADEDGNGGFKVLVGTPEIVDMKTMQMEDGRELDVVDHACYREPYTSIIHSAYYHYNADFSAETGEREATGVEYARLFDSFGDANYNFRASVVQWENPYAEWLELQGSTYEMWKDENRLFAYFEHDYEQTFVKLKEIDGIQQTDIVEEETTITTKIGDAATSPGKNNPVGLRDLQYWVKDSVVYSVTKVGGYADNYLFINDRKIDPPQPKKDVPVSEIHGVCEIDGQMYVIMHYNKKGNAIGERPTPVGILVPIDQTTTEITLENAIELEVAPTGMCATDGKAAFFMAGTELYRTDGKGCDRLTNIEMCGYNESSTVRRIRPLSDGSFLMVVDYRLVRLTPSEEEFVSTIQKLVIGTVESWLEPSFGQRVEAFNRAGKNAVVELKTYNDIANLNLAMLSGEVDFVVSTDKMLLRNYANRGYLAPMEEVCPELFEGDKLLSGVVEASRYEGHIYDLPRIFFLYGWMIPADSGIPLDSMEGFAKAAVAHPQVNMKYSTRGEHGQLLLTRYLDEWVDFEKKTCHFDDGSFAAILELCALGAKDQAELDTGDATPYLNYTQITAYKDVWELIDEENPKVYCSVPSAADKGTMVWGSEYLAVVDKKDVKEAQAEFLMHYFYEENRIYLRDESGLFSIKTEETANRLKPYEPEEGEQVWVDPNEPALEKATWDLLENAGCFAYVKNDVTRVLLEEAGRYFAGEITAEQAADYVQNRISIYLAEQS